MTGKIKFDKAEEAVKHNQVTETIIIGILASGCQPVNACDKAKEIMRLITSRGYEPQIKCCNWLRNGKAV